VQDVADVREDDGSTTERFLTRMRDALSDLPPAEVDELQPGDLITYGEPVDHIAFWLGEGRILHSTGRESGIGVVEEAEPEDLRARRHKLIRL